MTRTKTNKQPYKTNTNKEIDDRNIKEINHIDINKEQRSKYLDQIIKKYTGL
jgi:hypothetical protein